MADLNHWIVEGIVDEASLAFRRDTTTLRLVKGERSISRVIENRLINDARIDIVDVEWNAMLYELTVSNG